LLERQFTWYEEAGGLRATEETDSDRRREEEEEEEEEEEDGTVSPKPPSVQQVPLLVCVFVF